MPHGDEHGSARKIKLDAGRDAPSAVESGVRGCALTNLSEAEKGKENMSAYGQNTKTIRVEESFDLDIGHQFGYKASASKESANANAVEDRESHLAVPAGLSNIIQSICDLAALVAML